VILFLTKSVAFFQPKNGIFFFWKFSLSLIKNRIKMIIYGQKFKNHKKKKKKKERKKPSSLISNSNNKHLIGWMVKKFPTQLSEIYI